MKDLLLNDEAMVAKLWIPISYPFLGAFGKRSLLIETCSYTVRSEELAQKMDGGHMEMISSGSCGNNH